MERIHKIARTFWWMLLAFVLLRILIPVLICDRFVVRGESMYPTFASGDVIFINKLLMGPRIYKNYDFTSPKPNSFRIPGMRKVHIGDIVVFNVPYGREEGKIEFKINYVYAKRCLGCPGDTIGIKDAYYYNTKMTSPFGCIEMQNTLRNMPDSLIPAFALAAYPYSYEFDWTIKKMGPLIVPAKGMEISLNKKNVLLYGRIIEYETGYKPIYIDSLCTINGVISCSYLFKKDYYYFVGDNALDSKDSRYFGFVPNDFIVGIVQIKPSK